MRKLVFALLFSAAAALVAQQSGVFAVLKSAAGIGRQPAGYYLLPTNQLLSPWGEQNILRGRPVDMTFDSGKRILAVLNVRSVNVLDGSTGTDIAEIKTGTTSYTGIAFRPGDRELWISETTRNGPDAITVTEFTTTGRPGKSMRITLKGHPVPAGIAFSADGKTAYVAFSRNNSLAVIDAAERTIRKEIPVGIAPYGVAVSKSRGQVYVSNRGGRRPAAGETTAPSAGTQVLTDPVTGSTATGTLSMVNPETLATREVAVGLAPAALVFSPDEKTLAVANSHSDSISLLDTATLARTDVRIPTFPDATIGSQPVASAFASDGKTLYVACGGNNAIAVLTSQGKGWKVTGALPTGWFPTALAVALDGSLRVLNIKGVGNTDTQKGGFNSRQYEGNLLRIPAPTGAQVAAGTREVKAANNPVFEPQGGVANLESLGIRHVFLIIKENRTYDQVFGDLAQANGDPKLCIYGRDVTPNHHALAEKYVVLDNFYCGGAISFDGHQWLMQGFVSDYVERSLVSAPRGYAWNMSDALVVPPTGFFWQGARKPLSVRIYGEFGLPAKWDPVTQTTQDMDEEAMLTGAEYWRLYREGKWRGTVGGRSGVPALQPLSSHSFPGASTLIPDQIRADDYLEEFAAREKRGDMPQLSIIDLNNDHTNGTRPTSRTPKAMVADNDVALGRIVEAISKSRFWPNSLILVVEDDAQDGVDHVDGHRTVALAIGPHIRRGTVDSTHFNHTSMIRTIQDIYRVPPRTRFLASARAMNSAFTAQADLSPYKCTTPKQSMDEMNPPLKALNGRRLWAARQSMAMTWSHPDDIDQDVLNRILWWDAKGWDAAYPSLRTAARAKGRGNKSE